MKNRNLWTIVVSILLFLPNLLSFHLIFLSTSGYNWEEFEPKLTKRLTTVNELINYVDAMAIQKKIDQHDLQYGELFAHILRKRFYHGYSHYSLKDNWIAALCGKLIWYDLSAIVEPDDLLKYPMAACSQQSLVLIECFKRKGIPYRKIGFKGHFAVEGFFNGKWYFFDTNMEPSFSEVERKGIDELVVRKELYTIYFRSLDSNSISNCLTNMYKGSPNVQLASHAKLFHRITDFLSHFAFIIPLLFLLIQVKDQPGYIVADLTSKKGIKDSQTTTSLAG